MIRKNDVLGYSNMKIFQDTDLFSFSLDSVILANYTNIRLRDNNIVDFCTGNAIVPLILSRRCSKKIIGIYDRGITFWKNANEVGNYSLDNRLSP